MAVARQALADHRAGQDIKRGEHRGGAVARVVVGHVARPAGIARQARLGAIQRLDLALLVNAQHHRTLGRVQDASPTTPTRLLLKPRNGRQLECLDADGLEAARGPRHAAPSPATLHARGPLDLQLQCVCVGTDHLLKDLTLLIGTGSGENGERIPHPPHDTLIVRHITKHTYLGPVKRTKRP